jgi:Fucose permease
MKKIILNDQKRKLALMLVIYLVFVGLGLPDGVLGVAWPSIREEMRLPLDSAGILTAVLFCMSALSSVACGRLLKKYGTGMVTAFSILMSGFALFAFSLSPNFLWLIVFAIPLGLGQGGIDTGVNLYVAEHYTARHMNWLHCFWGIGASVGPLIMTAALTGAGGWRKGYGRISGAQLAVAAVLLCSLIVGLWKKGQSENKSGQAESAAAQADSGLWRKHAQLLAVLLFFLYAGIEYAMGLWLNSVLVEARGIPIRLAGLSATAFYGAIMAGRFLTGIVVNRLGNMRMLRAGLILAVAGCVCSGLSRSFTGMIVGTVFIGLGLAPVYPCLIHITPARFKKSVTERLIGYQVGAAWVGGSVVSAVIGVLLSNFSLELLFPVQAFLIAIVFAVNEILHRNFKKERQLCGILD